MKIIISVFVLTFLSQFGFGQKMKFKEKTIISIASKAKDEFPVIYTDKIKFDTISFIHDSKGDIIPYQLKKQTDWEKAQILDTAKARVNRITKGRVNGRIKDFRLKGEITPKGEYLVVNFYPIDDSVANNFFKKNDFAIKLPTGTNLAFPYRRWHAGVMVLPMKIYLSSGDNNIETASNVGIYLGGLFGTQRYVKLPSEENYRVYEYGWSLNGFAGVNKLDLDEKNTINASTTSFKGSVLSSSLGASVGWHYKAFSVFVASGVDIPLSNNAKDWSFKNKPWIGFGAGFEIF